jgi:hypothetical protein
MDRQAGRAGSAIGGCGVKRNDVGDAAMPGPALARAARAAQVRGEPGTGNFVAPGGRSDANRLLQGCKQAVLGREIVSQEETRMIALLIAAAVAGQAPEDAAKSRLDGSREICHTIRYLGSRLNRARICKTKAEWDAAQADHDRGVLEAQTHHRYWTPH